MLIRRAIVLVLIGTAVASAAYAFSRLTAESESPADVAREFGIPAPAWRVEPPKPVAGYRFAANREDDGAPTLAYSGPASGGASRLVAVGRGGWALEARIQRSSRTAVIMGAAVRPARYIRIGRLPRLVGTVRSAALLRRTGVRFFMARVPRAALRVHANNIVALDRKGRLLGRQHYNDGHGGFGARDGRWEKAFDRKHGVRIP